MRANDATPRLASAIANGGRGEREGNVHLKE